MQLHVLYKTIINLTEVTVLLTSLPVCLCYSIKLTDWSAVSWSYILEENKWLPMRKEGKEMFYLRVIFSLLNKLSTFNVFTSKCRLCFAEGCRIWSAMNTRKGDDYLQPGSTH